MANLSSFSGYYRLTLFLFSNTRVRCKYRATRYSKSRLFFSVRPEIVDFGFPMRFSGSVFAAAPKRSRDLRQA